MKMEKRENFESFEEQEKRAQKELNGGAYLKAAALAGLFVFAVPAGPWMSSEMMVNVMGRGLGTHFFTALILHSALALLYGWIIALCIFALPLGGAIGFGALLAFPLYAVNYVVFAIIAGYQANEIHAGIAHFMFALFFSVGYRAMAVPPPRRKDNQQESAPVRSGGLGT